MSQIQIPPLDQGNPFIAEVPAALSTAAVQTQAGPRMAFTLRAGNGTLTALIERELALTWAEQIQAAAGTVSPLFLPGPGAVPSAPPNGHQHGQ